MRCGRKLNEREPFAGVGIRQGPHLDATNPFDLTERDVALLARLRCTFDQRENNLDGSSCSAARSSRRGCGSPPCWTAPIRVVSPNTTWCGASAKQQVERDVAHDVGIESSTEFSFTLDRK